MGLDDWLTRLHQSVSVVTFTNDCHQGPQFLLRASVRHGQNCQNQMISSEYMNCIMDCGLFGNLQLTAPAPRPFFSLETTAATSNEVAKSKVPFPMADFFIAFCESEWRQCHKIKIPGLSQTRLRLSAVVAAAQLLSRLLQAAAVSVSAQLIGSLP